MLGFKLTSTTSTYNKPLPYYYIMLPSFAALYKLQQEEHIRMRSIPFHI